MSGEKEMLLLLLFIIVASYVGLEGWGAAAGAGAEGVAEVE